MVLGNLCLCFYIKYFQFFSSFLGKPVQIALTLDIASISSISESNMVSVALHFPPEKSLSMCLWGYTSNYLKMYRPSARRMAEAGELSPNSKPWRVLVKQIFWVWGGKWSPRPGREKWGGRAVGQMCLVRGKNQERNESAVGKPVPCSLSWCKPTITAFSHPLTYENPLKTKWHKSKLPEGPLPIPDKSWPT